MIFFPQQHGATTLPTLAIFHYTLVPTPIVTVGVGAVPSRLQEPPKPVDVAQPARGVMLALLGIRRPGVPMFSVARMLLERHGKLMRERISREPAPVLSFPLPGVGMVLFARKLAAMRRVAVAAAAKTPVVRGVVVPPVPSATPTKSMPPSRAALALVRARFRAAVHGAAAPFAPIAQPVIPEIRHPRMVVSRRRGRIKVVIFGPSSLVALISRDLEVKTAAKILVVRIAREDLEVKVARKDLEIDSTGEDLTI